MMPVCGKRVTSWRARKKKAQPLSLRNTGIPRREIYAKLLVIKGLTAGSLHVTEQATYISLP